LHNPAAIIDLGQVSAIILAKDRPERQGIRKKTPDREDAETAAVMELLLPILTSGGDAGK
jgi:hypothetical protein